MCVVVERVLINTDAKSAYFDFTLRELHSLSFSLAVWAGGDVWVEVQGWREAV